ncbi:MAG: autotransporter outer membrane beta-barrel domain-containing protein [Sterolibacterium sp.]|nr:autotransporter outer membrane beta-barrel domain-containing protein [Sterolibacterium sp.]
MNKLANQPFLAIAGGVFAVVLSGIASAQTSGAPSYSPSGSSSASPSGSSSALMETVATQLISSTSLTQMLSISNAISFRSGGAFQAPPGARADSQRYGMAAGGASQWNAWGSVTGETFKYTRNAVERKLDTTNTVLGVDYALSPTVTFGFSTAFDRSTGSLFDRTTTGYTVAPYVGWQLSKEWSLDAIVGWGKGDIDSGGISIKPDRTFYGTNLSYTTWANSWQLSAKGSYLYGEENYGSISVRNKIDQWRLGGRVGYWMDGVLPYFAVSYSSDNQRTAGAGTSDLGENATLSSLGVDFISLKSNLTGGIVFSTEGGRTNSKRDSVMANINYRF